MGHTPTPDLVHLEIGNGRIVYQNGFELCRMPASCVTGDWIEKAEKIVRAVNSHEALLEAAKNALHHLGMVGDHEVKTEKVYLDLEIAIALAEGNS